jgi:hypothetical protein
VIRLRPSGLLAAGIVLVHAAALGVVAHAGLPAFAVGALGALVVMHGAWTLVRHAQLAAPESIVGFELGPANCCRLLRRDGATLAGEIAHSTLVTGRVVALAVRTGRWRPPRHVLLLPGRLDPETFRSLRVRLRWARA